METVWCGFHKNKMATAKTCFSGVLYGAFDGLCQPTTALVVEKVDGEWPFDVLDAWAKVGGSATLYLDFLDALAVEEAG